MGSSCTPLRSLERWLWKVHGPYSSPLGWWKKSLTYPKTQIVVIKSESNIRIQPFTPRKQSYHFHRRRHSVVERSGTSCPWNGSHKHASARRPIYQSRMGNPSWWTTLETHPPSISSHQTHTAQPKSPQSAQTLFSSEDIPKGVLCGGGLVIHHGDVNHSPLPIPNPLAESHETDPPSLYDRAQDHELSFDLEGRVLKGRVLTDRDSSGGDTPGTHDAGEGIFPLSLRVDQKEKREISSAGPKLI